MKILLVTTSFPQSNSGSEAAGSFVVDFAHELTRSAQVAVVAPGLHENIETDDQGLPIFRYQATRQPLSILKPYNPLHWKTIATTLGSGNRVTLKAAKELDAEYILALWALPSGFWAQQAAKKLNIPYATWALGSDIWSLGKLPLVKQLLVKVMVDARHRFADGYQLAEDVERICGKPCEFLPSARQLPVCGLPLVHTPPYRLAFLGRWHFNKGIDLLLDALQGLSNDDWKRIECVRIAGGGPLESLVGEKVTALQAKRRPVELEGFKNPQQAAELLVWSDIVLIPSRIESIPVIYTDALQANRTMLATPVGDFPRLADDAFAESLLNLSESVSSEAIMIALKKLLWMPVWLHSKQQLDTSISIAIHRLQKVFAQSDGIN